MGLTSPSSTSQPNWAFRLGCWMGVPSLVVPAVSRLGGTWGWRELVIGGDGQTNHQAAAAFLLPKESHCSKAAPLWASQTSSLSNWKNTSFTTCIFPFLFLGVALALVHHDLIHHFWCYKKIPLLRLHYMTSLLHCLIFAWFSPDIENIPFSVTFALTSPHPTSSNQFGRNPTACSSQIWVITPPSPSAQDLPQHRSSGWGKAVWNVSSCFPKITRNHALKLNTWGKVGIAVNTVLHPKKSSHAPWHSTAQARSTKWLSAFQGWLTPCC